MHGSAFHSPLQDMKGRGSSAHMSMDWLTRAGLLFHRTSGKNLEIPSICYWFNRNCDVRAKVFSLSTLSLSLFFSGGN